MKKKYAVKDSTLSYRQINSLGWRNTDEFRPFRNFVLCADCGNPMTSGLSKGKSGTQYLNITCGNKHCKDKRHKAGILPVNNTIRGETIIDFAKVAIQELQRVDKATYEMVKTKHFEDKNGVIKTNNDEIAVLKGKRTKIQSKEKEARESLYGIKDELVKNQIANDIKIFLNEINSINRQIDTLEEDKTQLEFRMEAGFPPYEDFLNFFENALLVMNESDNAYLIGQIVKLVFMNTKAKDKKVSLYWLNEPFDGFEKLKILNGVVGGARTLNPLFHKQVLHH